MPRKDTMSGVRVRWITSHAKHEGATCLLYRHGFAWRPQYLPTEDEAPRKRTPINLMCTLAHGPAPIDRPYAVQECGEEQCIHPQHLKWMDGTEKAEHFKALYDEGLREPRAASLTTGWRSEADREF